ncbi:hypothetical protein [Streptomyces griseofuscus]|uniref:Lipoprotein n=1 Tax=Streptomyces griseofuscus TaxID=146922 RepID=A0A3R8R991_9ACTN|nr:hypothetical protein [Streptomyces griseofuscus]QNT92677.1 lipoprotein [Streptomyces griseofuscus]RRQ77488.1 hypothetical protein CQW39_18090 [Streptomyces griseofuscus]RRQ82960.1 hypothetical protein CQW44_27420 [Streptomyces griseofuscus]
MPYPSPPRIPSGPRRRTLLASAAGAALLAGCTSGADSGGDPSATERARAQAAADSATLLGRYDAVLTAFPDLAERLRPLRTEVAAHAAAFREGTTPTATPSGSPSASPAPVPVPATSKDALASLAAAERALADRRAKALLDVPGESARLLAATAAAGAAHAYLLTTGAAK